MAGTEGVVVDLGNTPPKETEQISICSWVTAFARRGNGGAQLSWGDLQEATFRGSGGLN